MLKLLSTWKLCLFSVLIILGSCYYKAAFAQDDRLQDQQSVSISDIEKIHLHFDKPFYSVGDTIWFKAYLVNASNELTEHSKVLYVDLINESDFVLKSIKVPLEAGLGWADIPLDKELPGGNYRVRAYTNWLRNFGGEYFFQKIIPLSDVFQMQVSANIDYFYSEGQLFADLHYKNLDGTPLAGKDVRYTIPKNERRTISGRGQTDVDGKLRIRIDTADLGSSRSLTAAFKVDADTVFKSFSIPSNSSNFDVQFFPEGGGLVNNIPSRLGFKVVGESGLGVKATGYISDESNTRITSFDTEFAGMGMFGLNPQPERKYTAYVRLDNGIERSFSLPPVIDKGFVMTVSEDESNVLVKIKASAGLAKGTPVTLQAVSHGKTYVNSSNTFSDDQLVVKIQKDDLPIGIARLTLLSGTNLPLAERLIFIDHTDELNISLDSLQEDYLLRSKVSPKIRVTNKTGDPVLAHLSMTVLDESKVPYEEHDEVTILSNLLLTSELNGYIEKPNYYFTDKDEDKRRQLDILMMTQGWRRFELKRVSGQPSTEEIFKPEHTLKVSGKILTPFNASVKGSVVSLVIPGQRAKHIITNEMGRFNFDSLEYEDRVRLILSARSGKDRANVNIVLDSVPKPEVSNLRQYIPGVISRIDNSVIAVADDSYLLEMKRLVDLNKALMLDEVKVTTTRKRKVEESVNINGSEAQYVFVEKDFENAISMEHALSGKVPSLKVIKKYSGNGVKQLAMYRGSPMSIFIDGAPQIDMSVDDINIYDVAGIEILSGHQAALYGKGAILFVTFKSGKPKPPGPQLGILYVMADGYASERQFYSPRYDDPKVSSPAKDLRSTIYWNPDILTNNGESSDITFFTAEKPGTYRFIIEGVDEHGRLARKILTKEIK